MTWPTSTEWMAVGPEWTNYGFAAWVADMGPWEDVMPLPPPIRVAEAEEVDYWISPMPASGDINDFPDFSNDYFNTWAYNLHDGTYGSTTWATGVAMPGARVIVAVYPLGWPETIDALGPPPSDPPSWYAPHVYVPPPPPGPGEWQDCRYGGNWYAGWQADMGEYTGPWPVMPSALLDGAIQGFYVNSFNYDGDTVEFAIALPNPDFPDDPNRAMDNTYTTDVWLARRTFIGPNSTDPNAPGHSIESWETQHFIHGDGQAFPDGYTPPPAGYHLYVIAHLSSDNIPPHPASFYAPSHYAPLGAAYAYTEAGGWSEWQPAYSVLRPAMQTTAGGQLITSPTTLEGTNFDRFTSGTTSVTSGDHNGGPGDPSPAGDGSGITDANLVWPPPYLAPSTEAIREGWPAWLAYYEDAEWHFGQVGDIWAPIEIYNAYTQYNALGYHSITTWFWLYMHQIRDGWRAQTNPVAPPDELNYTGPLEYGVDYIDPPFGVFPTYGGYFPGVYYTDSQGLANMNGFGIPNHPDKFDHEHPRAIAEWVNIASYLVPYQFPYPDGPSQEVGVGLGSNNSYDEHHQEYIDLWIGTPPVITKFGSVYNTELPVPDSYGRILEYEFIDPIGSGMTRIQQFSLEWTCNGLEDEDGATSYGTIITPRVIGMAFGDLVPMGTERITVLMQAHSVETETFNPSIVDDSLPLPPAPHGSFDNGGDVGSSSVPYYMRDFANAFIVDPYDNDLSAPRLHDQYHGVPVRMHQPRWRFWRPNKIISNYVPPPPTLVASWSTL